MDITQNKYYKEPANTTEGSWNKELAIIMTANDADYLGTLSQEDQEAYKSEYDTWVSTHQQGVIGYTDEILSHLPANAISDIQKNQNTYRDDYLASYGFANPEKSAEMAITPDNKYYIEADNPVTQKAYNEMAMVLTQGDAEYFATLPEAQQNAINISLLDWDQTHGAFGCFGHTDKEISGIQDSRSQETLIQNCQQTRDNYLTAVNEKYPEIDIQSKIDAHTAGTENQQEDNQPTSVWGSIKNGVSGVFSKAREAIGKTTVGAYILSKYDAVKDWVKSKIDPNYQPQNPEDQKVDNVKVDENLAKERGEQADAELNTEGMDAANDMQEGVDVPS